MDNFQGFFCEGFFPSLLHSSYLRSLFAGAGCVPFLRSGFICVVFCREVPVGCFLVTSSVNCFAWTTSKEYFAGAFPVLSLARLFPRALFRNVGIHLLIPRSFFLAILCIDFLRALFRRGIFRASFLGILSVRFIAEPCFGCPIAGAFAVRFCTGAFSRVLFCEAFSARAFARLFRGILYGCIFLAHFSIDGFHGVFRTVVFRLLSRGKHFGAIFFEASFVHFFAGEISMSFFCEAFFPCLFCRGFFTCPLSQFFFCMVFRKAFTVEYSPGTSSVNSFGWTILVRFFVGAFSMFSFVGLLSRAILCRGDVHDLILSSVFGPFPCNVFLRALFPRGFCMPFF